MTDQALIVGQITTSARLPGPQSNEAANLTHVISRRPSGRLIIFAALTVTAMGLSACSNKGSTPPKETGSPTPSAPAATTPPAAAAGELLKAAAAAATAASYSATYELTTTEPARTGRTVVYRTPFATRLDITTGSQTVQVFVTADGTFTCTKQSSGQPMCVTLAGAGEMVAADVDPGLQHLFTSTIATFRTSTGLTVTDAGSGPAGEGLPVSKCFAVAGANADAATSGTFCYSADGYLSLATFAHSKIALVSLGESPTAADLTLPATPNPLKD